MSVNSETSILFACVARGTAILAKHAICAGNFVEVCEQVLAKVSPDNSRLTYSHLNYLFHYIMEDRIIYLCVTDDTVERQRAFDFLVEIKRRFIVMYQTRGLTAMPYAMNTEFSRVLLNEMRHFSQMTATTSSYEMSSHMDSARSQMEDVKAIMVRNIDSVVQRGERLELLVEKSELLNISSTTFRQRSGLLSNRLYWRNAKIFIMFVVTILVVSYFIVCIACGGFKWPHCVSK